MHSNAQLADALTKPMATSSLMKALAEGAWILAEDPTFYERKASQSPRKTNMVLRLKTLWHVTSYSLI
jgi:hypothetical protein